VLLNFGLGTYREEDVSKVHDAENDIADFGLVEAVRGKEQGRGEDVMGKHLPVVFSALFDVDDEELVHPKGELDNVVPLDARLKSGVRESRPELFEIEPVVGSIENVLQSVVSGG
jgi:hypothetical protein